MPKTNIKLAHIIIFRLPLKVASTKLVPTKIDFSTFHLSISVIELKQSKRFVHHQQNIITLQ